MSLDNLVRIGSLKKHQPAVANIRRLLQAAQRNLDDAAIVGLSDETRFDIAYKAIMQCALAGLLATGYRPSTNTPGHHQTMIQSLGLMLEVPSETWMVLDVLRRKRNLTDYTGDLIDEASVEECLIQSKALLHHIRLWLKVNKPGLME